MFADKEILEYQSIKIVCRRDFLFWDINNYQYIDFGVRCLCCDICAITCDCDKCSVSFEFTGKT